MDIIKEALCKEAEAWITDDHTLMDWIEHVMTDPSDKLLAALQSSDIEDDEEYEDMLDELIISTFLEEGTG